MLAETTNDTVEAALHRVYQYLYLLAVEAEEAQRRAASLDFGAIVQVPEGEPAPVEEGLMV